MTMIGRGKKKAAKEKAAKEEAAQEVEETETSAEAPEEAQEDAVEAPDAVDAPEVSAGPAEDDAAGDDRVEDDGVEDDGAVEDGGEEDPAAVEAAAKLVQAKAELAKAEAELAKARLAEAEAELARAEKAAKAREKAKTKSYKVTTIEPGPVTEPEREPRRPMSRGRLVGLVAGLGVAAVLLASTSIFLWLKKSDQDATDAAGRDALTVAAAAAQDFSSYDYRSLDSSFKTAMGEATGEWLKQYRQLADQIKTTAAQSQVVVVGTVLKTGLEQVSTDRVVAVVFLNQQTAKAGQDKGYDQYRLRLTLVKQGGRWLVSNLQAL